MDEKPKKRLPRKNTGISYSQKHVDAICSQLASGKVLIDILQQPGMPGRQTVYDWLVKYPEFFEQYERARNIGTDALVEEALLIADNPDEGDETICGPKGTTTITKDQVAHRKLRVWTRLQCAARFNPKKYGHRVQAEHTGEGGGPILVQSTPLDDAL